MKKKLLLLHITAIMMVSSVDAIAANVNGELRRQTLSDVASEFGNSSKNNANRVFANQLVSAFDSIAKNGGSIDLIDSNGNIDLRISVGLRDDSGSTNVFFSKNSKNPLIVYTYNGLVNGKRAKLVRSGEELGISWADGRSGEITLREFRKNGPEKKYRIDKVASGLSGNDVVNNPSHFEKMKSSSPISAPAAITAASKGPINFWVFIHNDVAGKSKGADVSGIHAGYFSWFIDHLKEIIPGTTINIIYYDNNEIASVNYYASDDSSKIKVLYELEHKVENFIRKFDGYHLFGGKEEFDKKFGVLSNYRRNKFLLFTESNPSWTVAGYAAEGGHVGVASNYGYQIAAHEFGHMIGATHENADVIYTGGWWCETIMKSPNPLRSNCYRYSDENIKLIRNYFSWSPASSSN
ncbi:reprolysin-like metallopeptidase [Burkholderia sp. HI2714]|uniref:reprolysin-like metallopeptidase n=1 Tax=Burkholderia sp. HI2714 TaxID=2015359 RepID=UPI0011813DDE|nr:hypothetical protein [Burkholderia sp. HI2714]